MSEAEDTNTPTPVAPVATPIPVATPAAATATVTTGPTTEQLVKKYLSAFTESKTCPDAIKPHLVKFTPQIASACQKASELTPYLQKAYNKGMETWETLKPYKLELLLPSMIGFVMCFFGGSFLTLIAAVEAFKLCGYENALANIKIIIEDVKKVIDVSMADDKKDDDHDGTADVLQVSNVELVKRKVLLILRTVDPVRITNAITAINAGFLGVIATLKLQFAKTITLGNAIADTIEAPIDRYVIPKVEPHIPEDYRKWIRPVISYSIRSVAISIAWFVQRVISALHSALRGGLMCSRNILKYLSVMKIYELDEKDTYMDEVVGYGLAAIGLIFQLTSGFSLPFPLNILLFPFSIVEYILVWFVAK